MLLNSVNNLEFDEDKLILFYDSSVLETGRTGLAICDDGIHWKDISTPPRYLNWEDFLATDISHDDYYIYFGDKEGVFVFHRDVDLLIELIETIRTSEKEELNPDSILES